LPTEAEWEFACRAGTKGPYNFGNAGGLPAHGWFKDNSDGKTHMVGLKPANGRGLFDMHGNVAEWCADLYEKDFYHKSQKEDPQCVGLGEARVVRGGSWANTARNCRSANRTSGKPDVRYDAIGFRVALTAGK